MRSRLLLLALASALPAGSSLAQTTAPARAFDPANLDRKFGACQDFYMFANNGWIVRNPIPAAFSGWGSFNELTERNNLVLNEVVERAAREAPTTSDPVTKKLGTFYSSCMDSTAAETAGLAPLDGELQRIVSLTGRAALQSQIARMHMLGFGGVFGFGSEADPKNAAMVIAHASLRDWWTPEDAARYNARARVVEDQYGAYVAIDTLRVNGKLTLGENLADIVGVSVAYDALQRELKDKPRESSDGFTPEQRFFLGWAQARLNVLRPEAARVQVATDPHSPGRFRVNGPLANMPEFAQAFGCSQGDPMVLPAEQRARIW